MGTAVGSVDELRRPLVRILRVGSEDSFVARVDTGFNGDLLMSVSTARRLGFRIRMDKDIVEFADGRREAVQLGHGTIDWLGSQRPTSVYISPDPAQQRLIRDGDPVALVGTKLLSPGILLIDFSTKTVEVEAQ